MRSGSAPGEPAHPIQSVRRAVRLIEQLAFEKSAIPISQLSKKIGLHVSTTHRLLATLKLEGFVQQDPGSGRYCLGSRLVSLAQQYMDGLDLRQVAHPFLKGLSEVTGETAHLAILGQGDVVYLDTVEGRRGLRIFTPIGFRAPLHCTAAGKVLLAALPATEMEAWFSSHPLEALTPRSLIDPILVRQEVANVKREGIALEREESEVGAGGVAAPVSDRNGETAAALGVSAPIVRLDAPRIQELVSQVVRAARQISEQLGSRAPGKP